MSHKFFISHYSGDNKIAKLLSDTLCRITLEMLSSWYSSDNSGDNGLMAGDIWFDQILSKISESKAVVVLLTPNSINQPWIYFESGIGQALANCKVIPVCIGIKKENILPPFGLYQCYPLNDYRSVIEFFSKLLAIFSIKFDEGLVSGIIKDLVSEISKVTFGPQIKEDESDPNIKLILEELKNHMDKRFIEVLEKQKYYGIENKQGKIIQSKKYEYIEPIYSVKLSILFPEFKNELYVEIREDDTFQSVANSIYYMIKDYVGIWKYMDEWVIVDKKTNRHLIIREIGDLIPAKYIFRPNTEWNAIKLKKPYTISDSQTRYP